MIGSGDPGSCEDGDLGVLSEPFSESDPNSLSLSSPRLRYLAAPDFVARETNYPRQHSRQCVDAAEVAASSSSVNFLTSGFSLFVTQFRMDPGGDLPRKDPQEAKRHRIECNKIMQIISKRHQEKISQILAQQEKRHTNESRIGDRVNYWRNEVIPHWDTLERANQPLDDWWLGIPSPVRSQVWQLIIGNPLGITRDLFESCLTHSRYTIRRLESARRLADALNRTSQEDSEFTGQPTTSAGAGRSERLYSLPNGGSQADVYPLSESRLLRQISGAESEAETSITSRRILVTPPDPLTPSPSPTILGDLSSNEEASLQVIRLDVSRTFPMLGVFQSDGLHNRNLHDLLAAFVAYQPTLGYLQGMSFIAGILLLVMDDIYPAFVAFATLMNRPSFYAFYSLDESEFAAYFGAFDALLEDRMPRLFAHLKSCRLDCRLYLFDWLFTIFSRSLPLDVDLRIWDLFLRDGEAALLLSALGILRMYEKYLLLWDFDHLASFLTGPMPESMSPDDLIACMRSLDLTTADIKGALKKARNSVTNSAGSICTASYSDHDLETLSEAPQEQSEGQWTRRGLLGIRNRIMKLQNGNNTKDHDVTSAMATSKFSAFRRKTFASSTTSTFSAWNREVCLDYPRREISVTMLEFRLLLFLICLTATTAVTSSQESIELTCFDPECSTPYLIGEVITDLPERSLSKGTAIEIYGQSASEETYLIKLGEHFYHVHASFLRIIAKQHEPRSMVRVKLPRLEPSAIHPAGGNGKSGDFSTLSTNNDLPSFSQEETLSSQQNALPPFSENVTSDYRSLKQQQHRQEHVRNTSMPHPSEGASSHTSEHFSTVKESGSSPLYSSESAVSEPESGDETASIHIGKSQLEKSYLSSENMAHDGRLLQQQQQQQQQQESQEKSILKDSEASGFLEETPGTSQSVKQREGVSLSTLHAKENANTGPLESYSGLGKSLNVEDIESLPSPEAKLIESKLEAKILPLSEVEQSLEQSEPKPQVAEGVGMQISDSQSRGSIPKGKNVVGAKASLDPQFVRNQDFEIGHPSLQNTQTSEPRLKTAPDQEFYREKSKLSVPLKENEVSHSDQVSFEELASHQERPVQKTEFVSKSTEEMVPPESVIKVALSDESDLGDAKESDEGSSYTFAEYHFPGPSVVDSESSDNSPLRPLMDIATESTFFYCLLYASNGSFMSNVSSFPHIGEKSIMAGMVLYFARRYFNISQILLLKLPSALVSFLDRFLTFTFHLPLVFFIAWLLFIFSVLTTWLVLKLFNRLLFFGLSPSQPDDPTRRSLSEWLAVEENANLLAGSLADKEEAYARLIVWSTKVSERYEHQARNYSALETRIHNQLRDMKTSLADSLQENKELRVTHDALVEQLSTVKTEAAVTATRLREEIAELNGRLEECTHQCSERIAKEKGLLICEISSHQSRAENAERMVNELKEANHRFEEDLAARDRELSSLREAFIELKSEELKKQRREQARAEKKSAAAAKKKKEVGNSTDGWEVEDEFELDEIIEEIEGVSEQMSEADVGELQASLSRFLEVGRLRVALEDSEKQARAELAARKEETELRTQLQEAMEVLKSENADLLQRLHVATEDCDASKKKLDILSEYFKEREAVLQRDLGRQALSESESMEELKFLRSKQESYEVEIKTLRDQLASARREIAESERVNRRHISEMDKRLHENYLSARALENVVKDLRSENSMLRQKMFTGERAALNKLLSGIPPPPPPPPPVVALASTKLPEMRSTSRQSEKSVGSRPQMYPPPPFLPFPQIPLTGPGGSQFIPPIPPPPPPPPPPGSLLSQRQQLEVNRQSPLVAVPTSTSWDSAQSPPKSTSNTSGSNRYAKQKPQQQR
ncbi:unnamed protein product [Hydatigera taeniaeformis]|uniref:Rab-GAP TBC domain-containing protein n=1 Tax=Hydatigena taeniaeformis TaxID=6205 RepID=A0A0R3X0A0_HYDTA|nr:unnamed protein product [Hydatigera taeniaeformis]